MASGYPYTIERVQSKPILDPVDGMPRQGFTVYFKITELNEVQYFDSVSDEPDDLHDEIQRRIEKRMRLADMGRSTGRD